jgi:nucleotide-binding universal stress UspA family protein
MIPQRRIAKILFATDLSENAEKAFGYAVSMAEAYGARISILYVVEKLTPNAEVLLAAYLGYGDIAALRQNSESERIAQIKARIEQFCSEVSNQVPACRFILHDVLVEPGKPSERILHHAETGGYDAVVMGTRGHGLVREAVLGGTSHNVITHSPIPVFVVPMNPSEARSAPA